jgi:Ca2+-binding RTX toxin-like protein
MPRTYAPTGTGLDKILSGYGWNETGPIHYQFPNSTEAYRTGAGFSSADVVGGFSPLNEAQIAGFRAAFEELSHLLAVQFVAIAPEGAAPNNELIRVANTSSIVNSRANYPGTAPTGSDLWLGSADSGLGPAGSKGAYLVRHELAHALGLKHPFDALRGFPGSEATDPGMVETVAAYLFKVYAPDGRIQVAGTPPDPNYPQSFMPLDIKALQFLYGKNPVSDGDDLYTVTLAADGSSAAIRSEDGDPGLYDVQYGGAGKLMVALWDSGGADHLSLAGVNRPEGQTTGVRVVVENNVLGVYLGSADPGLNAPAPTFPGAVVAPAIRYLLDEQSWIERFTGSAYDDQFTGGFSAAVAIDGAAGADLITGGAGADDLRGGAGDDTVSGGAAADVMLGNGGADILNGGDGADTLWGGRDADRIAGGADDDFLLGDLGGDEMDGGAGGDILSGGGDNDRLWGGDGAEADLMFGGDGDDTLDGGAGADTVAGDEGRDLITNSGGGDLLLGGGGDDTITAGGDGDILLGNTGSDVLNGGGGADLLFGGRGDDVLNGGGGDDWLWGDLGSDVLTGGGGRDRFAFAAADGATDRITDFNAAEDVIDLSAIDANPLSEGDQAFAFVAAFSGAAGQATLTFDGASGQSILRLDVSGDGLADLIVQINGSVGTDAGWVM